MTRVDFSFQLSLTQTNKQRQHSFHYNAKLVTLETCDKLDDHKWKWTFQRYANKPSIGVIRCTQSVDNLRFCGWFRHLTAHVGLAISANALMMAESPSTLSCTRWTLIFSPIFNELFKIILWPQLWPTLSIAVAASVAVAVANEMMRRDWISVNFEFN